MDRFLLTGSLVLFFFTGFTQKDPGYKEDSLFIRRLADEVLVNGKAYENLRVLTKTVGARLSGSPGYYRAESWGQQALEAAGADKVYLQECLVPHWVRGGRDSAAWTMTGGPSDGKGSSLQLLSLGNSVGTSPQGIHAPLLLIRSFEELEQRKKEIKGSIVFYNYPFNPQFIEPFRAYGDAVRYRVMGASYAARYGALGVLVRSISAGVDNNPHTGSLVYNDSFPKIPAAAIGLRDADRLADVLQKGDPVSGYLLTHASLLPDTVAHNVIGEIRGSTYPDQIITVGGHLDSWDPAEGAQDDGAGCVHSIEVMRALKALGYKPRHTIRVVLFANEENGLRGGTKYAEEAKRKKERHLFALESDAGGFTPRNFSISLSPEKIARLRPWVKLLQPYGINDLTKGGGGADIGPLGDLGAVLAELAPDGQRYFDYHHSGTDVLENVNKRELELGALNMAALIYLVDKYAF